VSIFSNLIRRLVEKSLNASGGLVFVKAKTLILQYGCGRVEEVITGIKTQWEAVVALAVAYDIPGIPESIEVGIDQVIAEAGVTLWVRIDKGIREFAARVCVPTSDLGGGQLFGAAQLDEDSEIMRMAHDPTLPE
jgi:hypothetical protein